MIDIETYALAKAYTDKAIEGGGAIQGKNCIITEIEDVGNTHIVHFQWTLDDGTVETDTMTVEDGDLVEASETNGNIKINGVETQVYDDTELQDIVSTDEVTIEGNPINFSTLSAQKSKSTILSVEPIQDLHGYDKPWVGGAGKNLLDSSTVIISNWTFTQDDNGYVSETPNNSDGRTWEYSNAQYKLSLASGNYKVVIDTRTVGTSVSRDIEIFDSSNNQISLSPVAVPFSAVGIATYTFTLSNSTNIGVMIKHYDAVARFMIMKATETDTSYTPYENICPISGRTEIGILGCGKNLLNNINPTITNAYINVLQSGVSYLSSPSDKSVVMKIKSNTTYTFTWNRVALNTNNDNCRIGIFEEEPVVDESLGKNGGYTNVAGGIITFNSGENDKYIVIKIANSTNTDTNATISASQLEENNQSTTFSPYTKSNDLTISFGQTVYGGTLDVENGVLVVDMAMVDLGSLTWGASATNLSDIMRMRSYDIRTTAKKGGGSIIPNILSDLYKAETAGDTYSRIQGCSIDGDGLLIIYDERYNQSDSTSAFTTAMSGHQLVYELATPITINLTPNTIKLLEGVNNISTDGDKITLTYRDGSVATLGDLTSAMDNLDSKIDESKILTDTETGTKYRLVVTDGVLGIEEVTEPNALSTSPLSLSNSSVETSEESSEESNE